MLQDMIQDNGIKIISRQRDVLKYALMNGEAVAIPDMLDHYRGNFSSLHLPAPAGRNLQKHSLTGTDIQQTAGASKDGFNLFHQPGEVSFSLLFFVQLSFKITIRIYLGIRSFVIRIGLGKLQTAVPTFEDPPALFGLKY